MTSSDFEELGLRLGSGSTGLGESGGDDRHGTHVEHGSLFEDARDAIGGHRDDREVDGFGDQRKRGVGFDATDRTRRRVHRVDRPRKVAGEDRTHDLVARASPRASGADHRHGSRTQDGRGAGDLSVRLTLIAQRAVLRRRAQVDFDSNGARSSDARRTKSGRRQDVEHGRVVLQHVSHEPVNSYCMGVRDEAFEQQSGDAPVLKRIIDDERDLCRGFELA